MCPCVRVNESVVPSCSVNLYMWWAASPHICQIETGCSVLQEFKWSLTSFSCLTRHNERAAVHLAHGLFGFSFGCCVTWLPHSQSCQTSDTCPFSVLWIAGQQEGHQDLMHHHSASRHYHRVPVHHQCASSSVSERGWGVISGHLFSKI